MTTNIKVVRGTNGQVKAGQVTKTFRRKANIFGTPEYDEWEKFVTKNPRAKMMIITTSKTKRKAKAEKKIRPSYDKMISFINYIYENDNESIKSHIEEMNRIKDMAAINGNSYHMVVKWFNNTFEETPEYKAVFRGELSVSPVAKKVVNIKKAVNA